VKSFLRRSKADLLPKKVVKEEEADVEAEEDQEEEEEEEEEDEEEEEAPRPLKSIHYFEFDVDACILGRRWRPGKSIGKPPCNQKLRLIGSILFHFFLCSFLSSLSSHLFPLISFPSLFSISFSLCVFVCKEKSIAFALERLPSASPSSRSVPRPAAASKPKGLEEYLFRASR